MLEVLFDGKLKMSGHFFIKVHIQAFLAEECTYAVQRLS